MILNLNHSRYIARNKAQSLRPILWDGLVSALVPAFGNQGAILKDYTQKRNIGTLVSLDYTDYVLGKYGRALKFTNNGERVNFGVGWWNANLDGASASSVVVGLKYNTISLTDDSNTVFEAFNPSNAVLIRSNGASKQLQVGGRSQSSDGFQSGTGTTDLSTLVGTNIQITAIFDYQNDKIFAYINGDEEINTSVSFGSSTYNADGSPSTSDCLAGSGVSTRFLGADISYCYVYNYCLSQTQVRSLWIDPFIGFRRKLYTVVRTTGVGPTVSIPVLNKHYRNQGMM